jgi:hypothetical protein
MHDHGLGHQGLEHMRGLHRGMSGPHHLHDMSLESGAHHSRRQHHHARNHEHNRHPHHGGHHRHLRDHHSGHEHSPPGPPKRHHHSRHEGTAGQSRPRVRPHREAAQRHAPSGYAPAGSAPEAPDPISPSSEAPGAPPAETTPASAGVVQTSAEVPAGSAEVEPRPSVVPSPVAQPVERTTPAKCYNNVPDAVVCTSPNFNPNEPVNFVAMFHGIGGSFRDWARAAHLPEGMAHAPRNTMLVMPATGAYVGAFEQSLQLLGVSKSNIRSSTLIGHSAGGSDLSQAVNDGRLTYLNVRNENVVALASLYSRSSGLENWISNNVGRAGKNFYAVYDGKSTAYYSGDLWRRTQGFSDSAKQRMHFVKSPVDHYQEPAWIVANLPRLVPA